MKTVIAVILLIIGVVLGGVVVTNILMRDSLDGTHWNLEKMDGSGLQPGSRVMLEFNGGQVTGFSGCNSYSAAYSLRGDKFKVGPIAGTLMACADNDLMIQEQKFGEALGKISHFRLEGDQLTFSDETGTILLLFTRQ